MATRQQDIDMVPDAAASAVPAAAEWDGQPFLKIQRPVDCTSSPPVLSFQRKREVEIPWDKILPNTETLPTSVTAIREYFERSWGLTEITPDAVRSTSNPSAKENPSAARQPRNKRSVPTSASLISRRVKRSARGC